MRIPHRRGCVATQGSCWQVNWPARCRPTGSSCAIWVLCRDINAKKSSKRMGKKADSRPDCDIHPAALHDDGLEQLLRLGETVTRRTRVLQSDGVIPCGNRRRTAPSLEHFCSTFRWRDRVRACTPAPISNKTKRKKCSEHTRKNPAIHT